MKPRGPGEDDLARVDRLLKREYSATLALYKALHQDTGLGALRPIALLPEYRAIATEEVPGQPWGDILAAAPALTDELQTTARRVGAWVRIYQGIGDSSSVVELTERRTYLDDRLKLLQGRVLSPADRETVLRRFDALAAEIGTPTVPAVAIHADLSPMNIIVDAQGRVTVLDFTMAKTGAAHHDLSHMYFHLELMGARHRARKDMFHALQRAMLSGYDPALSPDHPLFVMMVMQQAVCHVALLAERRLPLMDAAYRWFLRRRWHLCGDMWSGRAELSVAS